eukprot:TRINITY_DN25174_c0_g1_i1.p1 TRINITY_DN25174_c0_g1~~TRINITY_DN25174_c0_g1_i1.p1  ORF type:complete len:394 (+),score=81.37 TRINITY_DN25174_c0_g1_i1:80-1261(+)
MSKELAELLAEQRQQLSDGDRAFASYSAKILDRPWDGWWGMWSYHDGMYQPVRIRQQGRQLTARWQGPGVVYRFDGELVDSGLLCVGASCRTEPAEGAGEGAMGRFVAPLTMQMGRAGQTIQMSWDWARLYTRGTNPRTVSRALPEIFLVCGASERAWEQLALDLGSACCIVRPAGGRAGGYQMEGSAQRLDVDGVLRECSRTACLSVWYCDAAAAAELLWRPIPLHLVAICAAPAAHFVLADSAAAGTEDKKEEEVVVKRTDDGLTVSGRGGDAAALSAVEYCGGSGQLALARDGDAVPIRARAPEGAAGAAALGTLAALGALSGVRCSGLPAPTDEQQPGQPFVFSDCCVGAEAAPEADAAAQLLAVIARHNPHALAAAREAPSEAPPAQP